MEHSLMTRNGSILQWHAWKNRGGVLLAGSGEESSSSRWENWSLGVTVGSRFHNGASKRPGLTDLIATKMCVVGRISWLLKESWFTS